MLARQLIIGEFFLGRHLPHGAIPNIAGQVILLRQCEIPDVERNVNTAPATFPRDLEITGITAGRRGGTIVGNEKIDPDRLVLLIGDVVEKIWNRKRECAMKIALTLRHQRVRIPARPE